MKKIVSVFVIILFLGMFLSCSKASKLNKIAKDSKLSDQQAVSEMVGVIWEFIVTKSKRKVKVVKRNNKLMVGVTIIGYPSSTGIGKKYYKQIKLEGVAKYMWRLLRYGQKRNIDSVVVKFIKPLATASNFNLYTVGLSMDQLKKIDGWDTLDPYNTGDYDILDESVRQVPKDIIKNWTVFVDNFNKIIIR